MIQGDSRQIHDVSRARRRHVYRWLNLLLFIVGVALFVLSVWLDVHDGVPTMKKGDAPFEVVLTGGLGIAALGNGLYRFWKSFTRDDERERDS